MEISRINYLSQFVFPLMETKKPVLKKEQKYSRVENVIRNNQPMNKPQEHDSLYFYNIMKKHKEIKSK